MMKPFDMDSLKEIIRTVPDWPKKGVMFRDITTLTGDSVGFRFCCNHLIDRYAQECVTKVVGIDARGFIFGSVLAYMMGVGFVPIRKAGKLPFAVNQVSYELEYGQEKMEIHKDALDREDQVVIVDDLLATGGTIAAACELVRSLGAFIVEVAFVVELPDLKGKEKLGDIPLYSMIQFDGE